VWPRLAPKREWSTQPSAAASTIRAFLDRFWEIGQESLTLTFQYNEYRTSAEKRHTPNPRGRALSALVCLVTSTSIG
jgi:hypothetical protein